MMLEQLACYTEHDADPAALVGQRVAIVGYGNLGRPAALNLRDAGVPVVVGARSGPGATRAAEDGFEVVGLDEAIGSCEVVLVRPARRGGPRRARADGSGEATGRQHALLLVGLRARLRPAQTAR